MIRHDECHRRRYVRNNLELRARILKHIRSFFDSLNFLEVETPIRIPAPAPEANIEAQESGNWFLHTSPELCMKRLVASGYDKIFQLCKCFRKHERGDWHLPEMTLLEWYEAHSDYKRIITTCELLLKHVSTCLGFNDKIVYNGRVIDFLGTWDRMTVHEAFDLYASMDVDSALTSDNFEKVMCSEIQPNLGSNRPIFLYDYPATLCSLAKLSPNDRSIAERFELYCAGIELCNGFTELTDSTEQKRRFQLELDRRKQAGMQVYPMPEPFLNILHSLPLTSGNALGIDRLVMLFADVDEIDQVVTFIPEEL